MRIQVSETRFTHKIQKKLKINQQLLIEVQSVCFYMLLSLSFSFSLLAENSHIEYIEYGNKCEIINRKLLNICLLAHFMIYGFFSVLYFGSDRYNYTGF